MPASAAPRDLVVRFGGGGGDARVIRDVLVGEVWLCGGQSNMFWPLGRVSNRRAQWPGVKDGEREVARAQWPGLRLNFDPEHELGLSGWQVCSPATVRGFSATAYFFGRELHEALQVPVGLVLRSRGGTTVQAWTPSPELESLPFAQEQRARLEQNRKAIVTWNRRMTEFRQGKSARDGESVARPDPLPDELEAARKFQSRGELHERLVAPVVPFALRGSIWYQGESNTQPRTLAAAYGDLLGALIAGYRRLWEDPALPFYFVQLPVFDRPAAGEHWHVVREGMRRLHERTPQTGLVVTYDFSDPTNLHPPEKQEVGRRLALWALARDYGQDVVPSGPLVREVRFGGGKAVVSFRYDGGLCSLDGRPLRGFEVAGEDGRFFPAEAEIAGQFVIVSSAGVAEPRLVRFFHGGTQTPNLGNAARLPASPFTTEP
jgi:sialate O-acetylesterase